MCKLLHALCYLIALPTTLCIESTSPVVQRLTDAVSDSAAAAGNKASGITGAPKRTYKSIIDSLTSVSFSLPCDNHFVGCCGAVCEHLID